MTPALVAFLAAEGSVPALPDAVDGEREYRGAATLEQIATVRWFGEYHRERVVGIIGIVERFDYHRLRDVHAIVHISGGVRAVRALLLHARTLGRPLIGEIANGNVSMGNALRKLGARCVRFVFEDMECRS